MASSPPTDSPRLPREASRILSDILKNHYNVPVRTPPPETESVPRSPANHSPTSASRSLPSSSRTPSGRPTRVDRAASENSLSSRLDSTTEMPLPIIRQPGRSFNVPMPGIQTGMAATLLYVTMPETEPKWLAYKT